jgi:hypothetical protein
MQGLLLLTMRVFISFLLIFMSSVSLGQGLVFRNYTTADGLNTSIIHNVFQDSRGYIWLSTDLGVTRFDGNEFKSFTEKDGLVGGQIFGAAEDSVGNVWFHSLSRQLVYYSLSLDTFIRPEFNTELQRVARRFFQKIDFHNNAIYCQGKERIL